MPTEGESPREPKKSTPKKAEAAAETPSTGSRKKDKTSAGRNRTQPPTKGARIIDLARREGITLAEIATALDTTPSTVSTLLSEARKKDSTIPMLITPEEKQAPLARFRETEHEEALNRQQEAIQLEAEEFSQDEIALLLGISKRTVRRYLQPPEPTGKSRTDREVVWREVWRLHDLGMSNYAIGEAIDMGRSGVGKILGRPRPPEPKREPKPKQS